MIAAVYHNPEDLRVEEVPTPQIGPGDLLVKVEDASICGTDLRILHGGHRKYPAGTVRIPGHEVVGRVVHMGADLRGLHEGQRVFIAPNWGCGKCVQCMRGQNNRCAEYGAIGITQDGAFAEMMRVPSAAVQQGNIFELSENVDPAAAALIEPFACVLRGQEVLFIRPGETVLILGAGPIGIMHLKLARLSGSARVWVSEPNPQRREQAARMGADRVFNPLENDLNEQIAQETGGQGVEVVIVAAPSHQGQEQALQLAGIGGRINFFGGLPKDKPAIQFDSNLVHYKELVVTGTTACSTFDCRRAAKLVDSGRADLSDLVSKRFPLSQAVEAFHIAEDRSGLKVVLEP